MSHDDMSNSSGFNEAVLSESNPALRPVWSLK